MVGIFLKYLINLMSTIYQNIFNNKHLRLSIYKQNSKSIDG